jgi:hypothetical protein
VGWARRRRRREGGEEEVIKRFIRILIRIQ